MSDHPYKHLAKHRSWRDSVAGPVPAEVDPVVSAKIRIAKADRVVTAGSCFAQNIARHLRETGFGYFVTETAHPLIPASLVAEYGYGVFSARYGNVYTSRQLVQLLQRAYGQYQPQDDVWSGTGDRFVDPFRPRIQPRGFSSLTEYQTDRLQHFRAVRRAIEQLNVFIFTLGLTECWISRTDGAAYPLCPGVAGGIFDENHYAFINLGVDEVISDLRWVLEFIRSKNSAARVILTVSPVPLAATAEDRSVLVSTTYSKSVLRVAAEQIAREHDHVAYFPAYEIITGAFSRGAYFAKDLRSITEAGVAHVMRLFMKHYALETEVSLPVVDENNVIAERVRLHNQDMEEIAQAICEEEVLDRAS